MKMHLYVIFLSFFFVNQHAATAFKKLERYMCVWLAHNSLHWLVHGDQQQWPSDFVFTPNSESTQQHPLTK